MATELKKQRLDIHQLPSGDFLGLDVFTLTSNIPGPHTYFQASVHGAELQGNVVIHELIKHFHQNPFKGKVTFVPLANPLATNNRQGGHTQGRFNQVTGNNWNRNYTDLMGLSEEKINFSLKNFVKENIDSPWEQIKSKYKLSIKSMIDSYQKKMFFERGPQHNKSLNLTLQSLAADADFVLDLHTGPVAIRYIYSAEFERDRVADLSFPFNLSIPNEYAGAMDEACFMPWVALQKEYKNQGREIPIEFESYTVELGSEEVIDTDKGKIDAGRLLHFLYLRDQLEDDIEFDKPDKQYVSLLKDYKTYYSEHGGLLEYLKGPGELFKKGEPLGRYLLLKNMERDPFVEEVRPELKAVADGIVINHATTCAVGKGFEVYQVMENYETVRDPF